MGSGQDIASLRLKVTIGVLGHNLKYIALSWYTPTCQSLFVLIDKLDCFI